MLTGRCACGAIRYRVDGPARDVINCHCPRCRRISGHYWAATSVALADVTIDRPDAVSWWTPAPGVRYGFCGTCGSSLFWWSQSTAGRLSIGAGTLRPPTGLRTTQAWWVGSASDYHEHPPGLELIEGDGDGDDVMGGGGPVAISGNGSTGIDDDADLPSPATPFADAPAFTGEGATGAGTAGTNADAGAGAGADGGSAPALSPGAAAAEARTRSLPVMLWMRCEQRRTEQRAPIVPRDAATLVEHGIQVVVEESPDRAFAGVEYRRAGCRTTPAGSWVDAPADAFVIGIKELPLRPARLRHRHVYFGHAYKGQSDAEQLLTRFTEGGGALLDLEYLVDDSGRRLAAFGYWAGYAGAALAVLSARGRLVRPLRPSSKAELDVVLGSGDRVEVGPALVIGALGRSGRGACDALAVAGVPATAWDVAQTAELDRSALLSHRILVNTVLATTAIPPFLRPQDVTDPTRALNLVSDVTCDVGSECNVLPIYDRVTSWNAPVRRLHANPPLDLIAIDNLPSLLPREASNAFSAELTPLLLELRREFARPGDQAGEPADDGPWERCLAAFRRAVEGGGSPR